MSLKQLELAGFKSFAAKTTLDFSAGITAIVGPNGSGKSNIIDAIRWLLGEREAKNIRGGKAEDLIFSGTPVRARVGMAQATITFDNHNKVFPSDYEEIAISRRVTRDGTSQYYINDAEVRLKDIVAFFAESRLGTRGLSIVNQGNSDIFVRAGAKERRAMIEEILGLRQYQLKKHEAQRKLVATKFNLEKIQAMIDELMPRLRLLRRQAARFEKQAEIEIELKELEEKYFGFRIGQLNKEEEPLRPQIEALDRKISEAQAGLAKLEQELAAVEKSGPKEDKSFENHRHRRNELLEKRSKIQQELGRLEVKIEMAISDNQAGLKTDEVIALLEEVWETLDQFIEAGEWSMADRELRPLLDRIEQTLRKNETKIVAGPDNLDEAKENLIKKLQLFDDELKKLDVSESQLAGGLEQFNDLFKKAFGAVDAKRNEIRRYQDEKSKLKLEQERIGMKRAELENIARQTGRQLSEFKPITGIIIDVGQTERRLFKLRAELAGIGELDPSLVQEAKEVDERHTFLKTQFEDLEKASSDLTVLIRDLDRKLHTEFTSSLRQINDQFNHFFRLMFSGGHGRLKLTEPKPVKEMEESDNSSLAGEGLSEDSDQTHPVDHGGIEIEVSIPRKKIKGLDMLSGGERSLVSIAALFALVSVSPPPFLVLDEIDAALDEGNAKRFADIIKDFSNKTQFLIVTHNRATMEAASVLYGITMGEDGTSKVMSLKLEAVPV